MLLAGRGNLPCLELFLVCVFVCECGEVPPGSSGHVDPSCACQGKSQHVGRGGMDLGEGSKEVKDCRLKC